MPRTTLTLMLLLFLLSVQSANSVDCHLLGVDGIKVNGVVHGSESSIYGDSALYASMIKNQLTQNGVYVIPDEDFFPVGTSGKFVNGAELVFEVQLVELEDSRTGNKTGDVAFMCGLYLIGYVTPSRFDSTYSRLRLTLEKAILWTHSTVYFEPDNRSAKSTIKVQFEEWVAQFIAELRESNSPSRYQDLDEYWREQDEGTRKLMQDAKESEKQ